MTSAGPKLERHQSIDVLRGVAVLGIFMMNIQMFAMVPPAYIMPPVHMDFTGANQSVWFAANVFFELKFITIFSALFGAGIVLMAGEEKNRERVGLHYRRMLWLLLIGMIHAYVIWLGDILVAYAVWGMVAILMRRMSARTLFIIGTVLFLLASLLMSAIFYGLPAFPKEALQEGFLPTQQMIDEMVAAQQAGGVERLAANAMAALGAQIGGLIMFGPRVLGVMLWGMALYKWGFFTAAWSVRAYLVGAIITLPIGLAASWMGAAHHIETGFSLSEFGNGAVPNMLFSPLTAFGYGCVIMLICKINFLAMLRMPFAAVGRMAFTNYLTQSLIGVFIFSGPPGLGFFGEWERTQQFQLVLAVWALQLIWSPLWLSMFRFGPFEWAWRSLTYWRFQPLLKAKAAA